MDKYLTREFIVKYKEKSLIVPVYASREKEYYSVEDLKKFYDLEYYLGEVNNHEAYITEIGMDFLKEVFGLKRLSELLYDNDWFSEEYKNSSVIYDWLKWWEKKAKEYN